MHNGPDPLHRRLDTGHLGDVSLHDLDPRRALQPGEIAHRQVEDTHHMPVSPAAGHQTTAHAPSPTRDQNRAAHVIVVPSIFALVTSAWVAFSSFATAAGKLAHFCSAASVATTAASVLHALVGGTLIIVLIKNLSPTSLSDMSTPSNALRSCTASAELAVPTAVLACSQAVMASCKFSRPLVNS